jgi:DNA-binding transcriptional MerR regulator
MFQAGEVTQIANISKHQLREWTGRRGILVADVPGQGRGRHALYSWSTVLLLKIVSDLKARFHVEIAAYASMLHDLRHDLADRSMLSLYGQSLFILSPDGYALKPSRSDQEASLALIIELDDYLSELAATLPGGASPQLPLFPVMRL